uniref:Uncharacterized protein n=1 Tax=Plectus sambesii TaxID=2011161 RepID=A0A914W7M6_9BILA
MSDGRRSVVGVARDDTDFDTLFAFIALVAVVSSADRASLRAGRRVCSLVRPCLHRLPTSCCASRSGSGERSVISYWTATRTERKAVTSAEARRQSRLLAGGRRPWSDCPS